MFKFDFNHCSASPVILIAPPRPTLGLFLAFSVSHIYMLSLLALDAKRVFKAWFLAVTPLVSFIISSWNEKAAIPFLTKKVPTNGSSIDTGSPLLTLSERNLKTYSQPLRLVSLDVPLYTATSM